MSVKLAVKQAYPVGQCWCGCKATLASPTAFFVAGHDKRAEAQVIKEKYGNVPNFLLHHGYTP